MRNCEDSSSLVGSAPRRYGATSGLPGLNAPQSYDVVERPDGRVDVQFSSMHNEAELATKIHAAVPSIGDVVPMQSR